MAGRQKEYSMTQLRMEMEINFHLKKKDAQDYINFVIDRIVKNIKKGNKVRIRNLGTFLAVEHEQFKYCKGKKSDIKTVKSVRFEDRVYRISDTQLKYYKK